MVRLKDRMATLQVPDLCSEYSTGLLRMDEDELEHEDMLVSIKVHSSTWDFDLRSRDFILPIQVIVAREKEMQRIAQSLGIRSYSWKESYIMQKVKECLCNAHSTSNSSRLLRNQSDDADWYSFNRELSVVLDIDEVAHPCDSLHWNPYLIDSLRKFYSTGEISVITEHSLSIGYNVLSAFKCMNIIHDKGKLTFDSFATLLRSKTWSAYYEHRERIAKWVIKKLTSLGSNQYGRPVAFVTSPNNDCFDIYLETGIKCEMLDMEASSGNHFYDGEFTCIESISFVNMGVF